MRKIIVLEHISLDGVIQAPGGRDEDTSGGFNLGGWISPYTDPQLGSEIRQRMNSQFDLLLGRRTYEMWAKYWPQHNDIWPAANSATKFVTSNTLTAGNWQPATILSGDVASQIEALKQQDGPDLHVWGSSILVQFLMNNDLVDGFWFAIYPAILGKGKRLFGDGSIPASFCLTQCLACVSGAIVANYQRTNTPNQ